jgi:hypothetical protein
VIASEDAEAAGVDGQGFVEAEFGAEVGDGFVRGVGMGQAEPRLGRMHIGVEGVEDGVVALEEVAVGGAALQRLTLYFGEEPHGAVFNAIPEGGIGGINAGVEGDGVGVPGPPEVIGKLVESGDAVGDGRENGQTAKDFHVGGGSSPSRRGRDATRRRVQVDAESHLLLYQAVRWGAI